MSKEWKIDQPIGLGHQRARDEEERAKKNAWQDDKRYIRVAQRGYRQALKRGDQAAALNFLDKARATTGTSGAGIKIAGAGERAASDRFDSMRSQVDAFNGQAQGSSPSKVGGERVFGSLAESGQSSGVWVNAAAPGVALPQEATQGPVSSRLNSSGGLSPRQTLFSDMKSANEGTWEGRQNFAERAASLGIDNESFMRGAARLEGAPLPLNQPAAPQALIQPAISLQGRALAESNIATMGQQGAVADYFRRSGMDKTRAIGNDLTSFIPPERAPQPRPERAPQLRPVSDLIANYDRNEAARIATRDKGYADSRSFREAAVTQADIAYRTQRQAQLDRFDTIIGNQADTLQRKNSFAGGILLQNSKPSPAPLPPMDYKNFDSSAQPAPLTHEELDARDIEQNKRFNSIRSRLSEISFGDAIKRDIKPVLRPVAEELDGIIGSGISNYDETSAGLIKTLNSSKASIKSAEEVILSTKGAGREPAQRWLIDNAPKNVSDYFRRQLEEDKKAKKKKKKQ